MLIAQLDVSVLCTDVHLFSVLEILALKMASRGEAEMSGQVINTFRHQEIERPWPYSPNSNFKNYDASCESLRTRLTTVTLISEHFTCRLYAVHTLYVLSSDPAILQ